MKLKALLCAGLMLVTSIIIPSEVRAETTYASASELITDAIEVAVTGVNSTTYDTAISNMRSKITISGAMVSYCGTPIGYWYSDDSDTIWSDSGRTSTVITPTDDGVWEFKPTVLQDILTDFNNDLIENVVPTTEDWSKIIGKYDVTLGNIIIDAEHWIPLTPSEDPLTDRTAVNLSVKWGWGTSGNLTQGENPVMIGYAIDADGKLYLQSTALLIEIWNGSYNSGLATTSSNSVQLSMTGKSGDIKYMQWALSTYPYVRIGMEKDNLHPVMYFTNADNSDYYHSMCSESCIADHSFKLLGDPSIIYDGDVKDLKQVGVLVTKTGSFCTRSSTLAATDFLSVLARQPSSSKKQIGNTLLKQRLSKFSALTTDDTVAVYSTGWTVIGLGGEEKNFDTYLGTQGILDAGDTADIAAVADAEALAFYVVAPTSLPVYMDSKGEISVATNASIENKSAASVTLTDVQIEPKDDSGWTMVQTTPSRKRDANEFTFSTSLVADTAIDTGAEHPFTYAVDLSPTTEGFESLDLASVLVTVDWTEVT